MNDNRPTLLTRALDIADKTSMSMTTLPATAITDMTWDDLVRIEPELRRICDIYMPHTVRSHLLPHRSNLRDVVGFIEGFSAAWNRARDRYEITEAIVSVMDYYVGWHARREALRTSAAWDTALWYLIEYLDAYELKVRAEVDAWLARRPEALEGPAWDAWLLDRPSFDLA